MHIRVTTDPISLNEVHDPANHPCHYQGDGESGLEIYFENKANMEKFIQWERNVDHKISLHGNNSDDYIAEG